ncbi:MAG: amidohydrolase family protein [Planctomycetales bacterium]|nr:amidohydrolase family protein [Planctomycetales bacterium]
MVYPIDGAPLEKGSVLFDEGRIVAIGSEISPPANSEVIDATGKHVYPGLIDADSAIGLVEIGSVRATRDYAEVGETTPNVVAHSAFNPDSESIPVARANGVLTALSVPRGGLVRGMSSVMKMDGWNANDMSLRKECGLHIRWPNTLPRDGDESTTNGGNNQIEQLTTLFEDARAYQSAAENGQVDHDLRLEAMQPVLRGKLPLFVHADEASQIQSSVAFAVREQVRLVIVGGYDAEYCAGLLRRHRVPVIITSSYRVPRRRQDPVDEPFTLAARLQAAEIAFCIAGTGRFEASDLRNLPYHAGTAVAYGLSKDDALRSITLSVAEILGVEEEIGSLAPGKRATLFVTDGDILEIPTQVEFAFIDGRRVDLNSRHTRLHKKYQKRYEK